MTTRNKNKTASREDQLKILKNKIQSIHHSDNILDSGAKFLTAEPKTNTSEYATVEDIKKSEGKTTALIRGFVVTIGISVIALLADARRDHQNLEKILELQNNLQKAINDNQQLRQEIEGLRKEFDSKLENEINKTIIEVYKLKLIRR
ncbi:MAG: hypothetical protein HG439_001220 [candidate division SR1 bacterium]|nr:hypothetical protein [candidate division SR1 bacterium]